MKEFIRLIRPRTLTASLSPVLLGFAFAAYHYGPMSDFSLLYEFMLFLVVLLAQAATNIWNEYFDYKSGLDFGQVAGNSGSIVKGKISPTRIKQMGMAVIGLALGIGVLLCLFTTWWLLPIGLFCIGVAYAYSAGPYPISRTPFGELASGFTMGFVVVFLAAYLWAGEVDLIVLIPAVPSLVLIGTILQTNSTRDMVNDEKHGRRTLAILLGRDKSIEMMATSYTFCMTWLVIWVMFGYLPIWSLIGIVGMIPASKAIRQFKMYSDVKSLDKAMLFCSLATTFYHVGTALGVGIHYLLV